MKKVLLVIGGLMLIGFIASLFNPSKNIPVKLNPNVKIDVASSVVKFVDGKHRYFFFIKNNYNQIFHGTINIELFTNDLIVGKENFDTPQGGIYPNLQKFVYMDVNTGPPIVHGANGVTKFKYNVIQNNEIVRQGEGFIPNYITN